MINHHFLIVSIGNPTARFQCLHSAGHFVNQGLQRYLQLPPFEPTTFVTPGNLVTRSLKYTMVQSPTLMNVSGPFVLRALRRERDTYDGSDITLVLLHDELEQDFGVVKARPWSGSARGNRGVQSCLKAIQESKFPPSSLARIAIGIGRPPERDVDTVRDYVIQRINPEKVKALRDLAVQVSGLLRGLETEWIARKKPE
ncbi:hypothetical protein CDD82_1556 [Ophiocordyceps australis]|uniref:Peptidyl-tRNA hydrolase n=1 Tax=Ophiocordyceps australis TaxID=1399860 RepID=A0A2C5ZN26_9HYPO|nr:hypothetical protein CDD82_1556 [Ophiocordyceps australis]